MKKVSLFVVGVLMLGLTSLPMVASAKLSTGAKFDANVETIKAGAANTTHRATGATNARRMLDVAVTPWLMWELGKLTGFVSFDMVNSFYGRDVAATSFGALREAYFTYDAVGKELVIKAGVWSNMFGVGGRDDFKTVEKYPYQLWALMENFDEQNTGIGVTGNPEFLKGLFYEFMASNYLTENAAFLVNFSSLEYTAVVGYDHAYKGTPWTVGAKVGYDYFNQPNPVVAQRRNFFIAPGINSKETFWSLAGNAGYKFSEVATTLDVTYMSGKSTFPLPEQTPKGYGAKLGATWREFNAVVHYAWYQRNTQLGNAEQQTVRSGAAISYDWTSNFKVKAGYHKDKGTQAAATVGTTVWQVGFAGDLS